MCTRQSPQDDVCRGGDCVRLAGGNRRLLALALVTLLLGVTLLALVGSATASLPDGQYVHNESSDDQAPTVANGTAINDTAFQLTISDNHNVSESSITKDEFILERGTIQNISVEESGPNATVTFVLEAPVNDNELTVSAVADTTISDTNGNLLGEGNSRRGITVTGTDGEPPSILEYSVTDATGGPAEIRVKADEELSNFDIVVSGPYVEHVNISSFSFNPTQLVYTGSYRPKADGELLLTLQSYTDQANNTEDLEFSRRIEADLTPPDPVIGIDLTASSNLTMVFDGGRSTDANGVSNYTWDFGDGTTATGERVNHTFAPGNYTVTLTATDPYGNNASTSIPLNLTTNSGNVTDVNETLLEERRKTNVTVQRSTATVSDSAIVTVERGRAGQPIAIGAAGGGAAIARHGNVSFEGLNLTLSTNRTFDLGISMAGSGSVSDAGVATGTVPMAGITVVSPVPDTNVANATFAFSVDQRRLDALNTSAANVSLARFHNGTWNQLPTTALNVTNGTVPFEAKSPGFSRFAVTVNTSEPQSTDGTDDAPTNETETTDGTDETTASANLSVTEVSLANSTIEPGATLVAATTVENTGNASGTYTAGLALNGSVVNVTESPSVGPNATESFEIQHTVETNGTYAVSVNETSGGILTVSTSPGESEGSKKNGSATNATQGQFTITNATVTDTEVVKGTPLRVNATINNSGDVPVSPTIGISLNGSVVMTETFSAIPTNESRQISVQHNINRTGMFAVAVNDTSAGTVTVLSGTNATNGTQKQFVVTSASLASSSVDKGEALTVNATVENRGNSPGFPTVGLALNGSVVATESLSALPANESRTVKIQYTTNKTGTYAVSVNNTTAGTVTVTSGGGGGLLGFLSILPVGIIQPVAMFVLLPVVVIYGVLKGLALYLGY